MRHVISALAALLVTMLLILVMIGLIRYEPRPAPVSGSSDPVTVVPVKLETPEPRLIDEPPVPPAVSPPLLGFARAPSNSAELDDELEHGPNPFKTASRAPMPLIAIEPVYPVEALREGTAGWVRIRFTIDPDGSVSDVSVVDAAPRRGIFDSAAVQALVRSRYMPKTVNGVAVPSRAEWTFNFTITGRKVRNVSLWNDS